MSYSQQNGKDSQLERVDNAPSDGSPVSVSHRHITVIGAGNWILATLRIVEFSHILKCRVIVSTVVTGVSSLLTLLSFMGSDVVMLEPLPTLVRAFYSHKLTSIQLILWRWILIQMFF